MVALIGLGLFAAALGAVIAVFWLTLAPALPRIAALLAGEAPEAQQPLPRRRVSVSRVARPAAMAAPAWRAAA